MAGSAVGPFTPASSQTCNVLRYDVTMAVMSLGDRDFSAPLYSYGTIAVYVVCC